MKPELPHRVAVLHKVVQGQLVPAVAGRLLGLSERQVRRLAVRYRDGGAPAVQHGNRGRQPAHTIRPEVRQRVVALAQTTYRGYNDYQLSVLLAEREGLSLSRSSVRRILQAAGLLTSQASGRV
jgi:transposase